MSWLPLSFGFPAILWGLLALPVIWWLLRLTPPKPQTRSVSAAEDPGARAEEGRDAAPEPMVADAASPSDGGADRAGAGRADFQSARGAAGQRQRAGAGRRQWLGKRPRLGSPRRHRRAADRRCQFQGRAGGTRLHRRKAQCRDRSVRRRDRTRPPARRAATPGAGRSHRRFMRGSPRNCAIFPAPASPCWQTGWPPRATSRPSRRCLARTPPASSGRCPTALDVTGLTAAENEVDGFTIQAIRAASPAPAPGRPPAHSTTRAVASPTPR